MKPYFMRLIYSTVTSSFIFLCSPLMATSTIIEVQNTNSLVVESASYSEGIGYDSDTGKYYVGSLVSPNVYQVSRNGEIARFLTDPRIISSAGVHVDNANQRLLVTSLDLGTSVNTDKASEGKLAGLGIYDLQTGKTINYINLAKALPGAHLANGIAVDNLGVIYVTDSSSPHIYKIDKNYHTSIFLTDKEFTGEGFNLNGIVYHKDGFLIVSKYNSNALYRIPINNPEGFIKIELDNPLMGPDGLVFLPNNILAVIQNGSEGKISFFISNDDWESAMHTNSIILENTYPTSGVVVENGIAVIDGHINKLFSGQIDTVKNFSIFRLLVF